MTQSMRPSAYEYAAWILAGLAMLAVLLLQLLPALIAGLLIYELVHVIAPLFARRLSTRRAKAVAVVLVALLVVATVTAAGFAIVAFVRSEGGSLPVLLAKMADILESSRTTLPQWLADYLPDNSAEISDTVSRWLRVHAAQLQSLGTRTGHSLAHVLIGMIIGAMVSLREAFADGSNAPLARALAEIMRTPATTPRPRAPCGGSAPGRAPRPGSCVRRPACPGRWSW